MKTKLIVNFTGNKELKQCYKHNTKGRRVAETTVKRRGFAGGAGSISYAGVFSAAVCNLHCPCIPQNRCDNPWVMWRIILILITYGFEPVCEG